MEASNNTESFSRFFSRSGRFPLGDSPPPPFPHLLYFRLFLLLSRIRLVTLFLVLLGRFTTLLVSVPEMGPYARRDRLKEPVSKTEFNFRGRKRSRVRKRIRMGDTGGSPSEMALCERRFFFTVEIRVISRSFPSSLVPGSPRVAQRGKNRPRSICKLDG